MSNLSEEDIKRIEEIKKLIENTEVFDSRKKSPKITTEKLISINNSKKKSSKTNIRE